jgi:hypothetical protein
VTYQYDTHDKLKAAQKRGAVIEWYDSEDGEWTLPSTQSGWAFNTPLCRYRVLSDPMFPDGPDGRVEWSLYTQECGEARCSGRKVISIRWLRDGCLHVDTDDVLYIFSRAEGAATISFSPPTKKGEPSIHRQAADVLVEWRAIIEDTALRCRVEVNRVIGYDKTLWLIAGRIMQQRGIQSRFEG